MAGGDEAEAEDSEVGGELGVGVGTIEEDVFSYPHSFFFNSFFLGFPSALSALK